MISFRVHETEEMRIPDTFKCTLKIINKVQMKEMTKDQIIEGIYQENQGFITRREMDERKIPSWFLSSFVKKKDLK